MSFPNSIILNNGVKMPILGLGTYKMEPELTKRSVLDALSLGYRHIDTASFYRNEAEVGEAIRDSSINRDDIFITTKVWNDEQGYEETKSAFQRSLELLKIDYVDLYLIHWPMPSRLETWRALESIYEEGMVRAIGVSNFMPLHLEEILEHGSIIPSVNQVEMHPFLQRNEVLDQCKESHIAIEASSPLARGKRLNDPYIKEVATKNDLTPAQVMIAWCLQRNVAAIPKTTSKVHMKENFDSLYISLSQEDIAILDKLDQNYRTTTWNPYDMK
ncbi:MAG: aldo/keto reductase [Euryarchaeota archaeon]|nr:aldo/keto reductase [Euryarchaeota archaeon]